MPWNRVLTAGGAVGLAALAGRYAAGVARADRSWLVRLETRLSGLGEVDEVSVLPLVERLIPEGAGLTGEPGVSYLIRAGDMRVLFDCGLSGARPQSALARNAPVLGVGLGDLDAVVIVALSGHDSTPWAFDAFSRRFGDRYRTLRAGEELRITAEDR